MPLYDYDCAACGRRFETIHGLHDDPPTECPLCGSGPVRKAFAPPAIHFKGSGWAKKERRAKAASSSTSAGEGGETSTDAASGEASSTIKDPAPSTSKPSSTTSSTSSTAKTD